MKFDNWLKERLEKGILCGTVFYDEIEDSYQLKLAHIDIGLCNPLWQSYENKKVIISIKEQEEED